MTRKLLLTFIPFIGLYWVHKYGEELSTKNPWYYMCSFIAQAIYLNYVSQLIPN